MIDLLNRIGFRQIAFGGEGGGGGGGGGGWTAVMVGTIILHRWPPQLLKTKTAPSESW
jgi:hypothetical protein